MSFCLSEKPALSYVVIGVKMIGDVGLGAQNFLLRVPAVEGPIICLPILLA